MIFGASIGANKRVHNAVENRSGSMTLRAANAHEAYGRAMEDCLSQFPQSQGWYGHYASVADVPQEWVVDEVRSLLRDKRSNREVS